MEAATVTYRSGMATSARRRFRLLDAMILVAATASGLAIDQWIGHASDGTVSWGALLEDFRVCFDHYSGKVWPAITQETCLLGIMATLLSTPLVAMWTLALIPIRLLAPRPRLRRLARQPGMMAICAASLAIVFLGLSVLAAVLLSDGDALNSLPLDVAVCFAPMFVGWSVLISWTTLLIGRRWRAEATWVDRLGRAAGLSWIFTGFVSASLFLFYPFVSSCQVTVWPGTTPATGAIGEMAQPLPLEPGR